MKKIVVVLVSLVVAVLVIGRNAFAHISDPPLGPEWKFVGRSSNNGSTLYINTKKITYLPKGIVEVPTLLVPRGDFRRFWVNTLKMILSLQGKDPNNAERFWYIKSLEKINCRTHQYASPEMADYSFEKTVLYSYPPSEWKAISPGSVDEIVEKHVCNETPPSIPTQYKQNIPEPSLGPEWKLVGRNSNNGSTLYFNTKNITYLPKGIVKVLTLTVPRGENRRELVNGLRKYFLFKGKDPNNIERLWYFIELDKMKCNTNQYAQLEDIVYSFRQSILFSDSYQHEKWDRIIPRSGDEAIENYVCKKYK